MSKEHLRCLSLMLILGLVAYGNSRAPEAVTKVFKHDGSVQCVKKGVSVEEMAKKLTDAGIDVICGQKGRDGYAHCAACSCKTGLINVYTIHSANVPDAKSLGFAPVSDLPDYRDEPCR